MHKGKNMLIKAIILSFTFIVGVFVMSAAWFTNSPTATASGLTVKAKKTEGLQISFNGTDGWSSTLSESYKENDPLPLITSTDGINFSRPPMQLNDGKPVEAVTAIEATAENGYYIEKEVHFRSEEQMEVSVSDIKVDPCVTDISVAENVASKSAYGNFSKDYIAAAARVAIATSAEDTSPFVYDPNPNIQLMNYGTYKVASDSLKAGNYIIFTDNSCYYSLTLKDGSDSELIDLPISMNSTSNEGNPIPEQMFIVRESGDTYTFESLAKSSRFLYYSVKNKKFELGQGATSFTLVDGKLKVSDKDVYLTYDGNSFAAVEPVENEVDTTDTVTVKLLTSLPCSINTEGLKDSNTAAKDLTTSPKVTLSKAKDTDLYYTGSVIVRIWVEGTDRDALLPLKDGKFTTQIEFSGTVITGS